MFQLDQLEPYAKYNLAKIIFEYIDTDSREQADLLISRWASSTIKDRLDIAKEIILFIGKDTITRTDLDYGHFSDNIFAALGVRGHFEHQLEVFFLGLNILSSLFIYISEETKEKNDLTDKRSLLNPWFHTAIGHDNGYAMQKAESITNEISKIYAHYNYNSMYSFLQLIKQTRPHFFDELQANTNQYIRSTPTGDIVGPNLHQILFSAIKDSIRIKPPHDQQSIDKEVNFLLSFLRGDVDENGKGICDGKVINHGLASALLYLTSKIKCFFLNTATNSQWNDFLYGEKFELTKKIVGAMALHNIKPSKGRPINPPHLISFQNNFLAYVLFIADNIQDWDRDIIIDKKYPGYRLTKFNSNGHKIEMEVQLLHDEWPQEMIEGTKEYLEKCSNLISLPTGANTPISFSVTYYGIKNSDPIYIERANL